MIIDLAGQEVHEGDIVLVAVTRYQSGKLTYATVQKVNPQMVWLKTWPGCRNTRVWAGAVRPAELYVVPDEHRPEGMKA